MTAHPLFNRLVGIVEGGFAGILKQGGIDPGRKRVRRVLGRFPGDVGHPFEGNGKRLKIRRFLQSLQGRQPDSRHWEYGPMKR